MSLGGFTPTKPNNHMPQINTSTSNVSSKNVPEKKKKKENQHEATTTVKVNGTTFTFNNNFIEALPTHVSISFDGACRGNGGIDAKSSCAVYVGDYQESYAEVLPGVITNNGAEIYGGFRSLQIAMALVEAAPQITHITIKGDSTHVIHAFTSGDIYSRVRNSKRLQNSELWKSMNELWSQASLLEPKISWEWVPRELNREADELSNAALDDRLPRPEITSDETASITNSELLEMVEKLRETRFPTIRTLPDDLAETWKITCSQILEAMNNENNREKYSIVFLILPLLLSCYGSRIGSKEDFKKLRHHITLLRQDTYRVHCLIELQSKVPAQPASLKEPASEEKIIDTLCSRGLHTKVFNVFDKSTEVRPHDEQSIERMQHFFPQDQELPKRLPPSPPHAVKPIEFGRIKHAVRKMRRGKSPGWSGWTRELIWPLIASRLPSVAQVNFCRFIFKICHPEEKDHQSLFNRIIISAVLIPLYYTEKDKYRPVTLPEFWSKVAFNIVLECKKNDSTLTNSCHTMMRPGNCVLATHWIQAALAKGWVIVCCDGHNAHNTIWRNLSFDYFRSKQTLYGEAYDLLNLVYTNPRNEAVAFGKDGKKIGVIPSKTGGKQGCASAQLMYTAGIYKATEHLQEHMAIVSDDVSIATPPDDLSRAVEIIKCFETIGQKMNGPKMFIIGDVKIPRSHLPACFPRDIRIEKECATVLGAIVKTNGCSESSLRELCNNWIAKKVRTKLKLIQDMPTCKKNKYNILQELQWFFAYAATTFCQRAAEITFEKVEQLMTELALKLTEIPDSPLIHHLLKTSAKDGGLGLFPIHTLLNYLRSNAFQKSSSFLLEKHLENPHLPNEPLNARAAWSKIFATYKTKDPFFTKFTSILEAWPKNKWTTLSDQEFTFFCGLTIGHLPPIRPECPDAPESIATDSEEAFHHLLACHKCASKFRWSRHERVLYGIHNALRYHCATFSSVNPKGYPLPGNGKGGPDMFVEMDNTNYAADVTIIKPRRVKEALRSHPLTDATRVKHNKYKEFARVTSFEIAPLVFSTSGIPTQETAEFLQTWVSAAFSPKLAFRDCLNIAQCEILRATMTGYERINAATAWGTRNDESNEDDEEGALLSAATHQDDAQVLFGNS